MEASLGQLIESLKRGSVIHLRGDFKVPAGDYKVLAVRDEYVKLRKGSGNAIEVTRKRLVKLVDSAQRFTAGEGVLSAAGYRVGHDGLPRDQRRRLLADLLSKPLNLLPQVENVREWSEPGTPKRYWKMVRCLQAFVENARGRKTMRQAIDDWESDLEWLNEAYGSEFTVRVF